MFTLKRRFGEGRNGLIGIFYYYHHDDGPKLARVCFVFYNTTLASRM